MHAFLTFPFFPFSPPSDIFYNSLYSTSNHSESAHSSTDHFFLPSHVISFYLSSISSPPIVIINQIDAEAADMLGQKYGQVENLTGAWHSKGGKLEYEVHFYGTKDKDNKYIWCSKSQEVLDQAWRDSIPGTKCCQKRAQLSWP